MVTTIKIHPQTKAKLDSYKQVNDSYDMVIQKLLENQPAEILHEKLKEGYLALHEQQEEIALWDQI